MVAIELIGVPFDGYGRSRHQAAAAAALRAAGLSVLSAALAAHEVIDRDDMVLPTGDPERGPQTSLINEPALLAMAEETGSRVWLCQPWVAPV